MTWHVLQTKPRAEAAVTRALRAVNIQTLWLHYKTRVRHARKEREALQPLFANYVMFYAAWPNTVHVAARTQGVTKILTNGDKPSVVPDETIERLRAGADENGLIGSPEEMPEREPYEIGAELQIIEGPLVGYSCNVLVDRSTNIKVKVHLFGGEHTATLFPSAVRLAEAVVHPDARSAAK